MFRDPRYLAPFGVLVVVILVSGVLAYESAGRGAGAPVVASVPASQARPAPPLPAADVDARRLHDLTKLRDAFLAYRRQHGKFPVTKDGVTTICAGPADPGCVLTSVAAAVAFADGEQPYWFSSDGSRVVLVAPAQAAPASALCPRVLPPDLAAAPVICLPFERPAQ